MQYTISFLGVWLAGRASLSLSIFVNVYNPEMHVYILN